MRRIEWIALLTIAVAASARADLALLPMPERVSELGGEFAITVRTRVLLGDPASEADAFAASGLVAEVAAQLGLHLTVGPLADANAGTQDIVLVRPGTSPAANAVCADTAPPLTRDLGDQGYVLSVTGEGIVLAANAEPGLFYAVQTLKQLVRANAHGNLIPQVEISDKPGMIYRGILDDITRGQSPTLEYLKQEVRTLAEFKMNLWTPYIEHQFEYEGHPLIAPEGGALTGAEARELTEYARRYHVEIVGCQQSFGHFANILRHERYAKLGEVDAGYILRPIHEPSYRLLGELYNEVCAAFESPLFNVCCDETWGLGDGKSKPLLEAFGIEWLYATHIQRIHDLLARRGKRMMMWADIALQHPGILDRIPEDTIMLSWGYHPGESFDAAIAPIADRGFEFFICPGVSCWSRMFPDIETALVNVRNYARDGARHGALGMINTCWDDDGENLFEVNWYPLLYGGECAWRPLEPLDDTFAERFSRCFLGTADDSGGRAELTLAKAVANPLYPGLLNGQFWQPVAGPSSTTVQRERAALSDLLELATQAQAEVASARRTARVNLRHIDAVDFAARRVGYMAKRRLDLLHVATLYRRAQDAEGTEECSSLLATARSTVDSLSGDLLSLRDDYRVLWLAEARPYWLDGNLARYDAALAELAALSAGLADAEQAALQNSPLPPADTIGAAIAFPAVRDVTPLASEERLTAGPGDWLTGYTSRRELRVDAGEVSRTDLPVEIEISAPGADPASMALVECDPDGRNERPVPWQWIALAEGHPRLAFIVPGSTPAGGSRFFRLYTGDSAPIVDTADAVSLRAEGEGYVLENDRVRVLVLPEGGHAYSWQVQQLDGLEITLDGSTGFAGFLDSGGAMRGERLTLEPVARGPIVARLLCTGASGTEKILSLYADASFVEVEHFPATGYFWSFDPPQLMASDSPTPGTALFPDGTTAPVPASDALEQREVGRALWSAKTRSDGLTVALVTPGRPAQHKVGPGGGWGGVGIQGADAASHFIVVGDVIDDPTTILDGLADTFDWSRRVRVFLGPEERQ